ncbi:GIY-YIG nuclease family protein [Catalinimonas niigatensis]|uniref:GIY-YIG nuclease family protein n=1 Tax=Catalinimonas niigatensis TaxID=1397264 RepID=UPI00266680EA|nr:GIY-YIG nuclease family protein [Catalinimonas niigatensis]WPP52636.1 GIY-YIG nuclease family protein [Catalinimonas niigatensis]
MPRGGCIYIMSNTHNTTLYIGVMADLLSRIQQHKQRTDPKSFTARYQLHKLVYYETFSRIEEAINKEKQLKQYSRKKKEKLITAMNPNWIDLWEEIKGW